MLKHTTWSLTKQLLAKFLQPADFLSFQKESKKIHDVGTLSALHGHTTEKTLHANGLLTCY
jgi:hypothetical protein